MITVDSFAGKKVTKGLYNKVLKVAQQIILDKTEEFIATGKQTPLTKEERETQPSVISFPWLLAAPSLRRCAVRSSTTSLYPKILHSKSIRKTQPPKLPAYRVVSHHRSLLDCL